LVAAHKMKEAASGSSNPETSSGLGRSRRRQNSGCKMAYVNWFDFFLSSGGAASSSLQSTAHFGSNPGNLRMLSYIPPNRPVKLPLVVVLHGGNQTAEEYASGSGWLRLADEAGVALLFPEQRRSNHPLGCFHWYRRRDTERGQGEGWSIISMVRKMAEDHAVNTDAVFITGLSAGGAMANAMLAVYPDVFAAGAVIAGLPFGAATDVHEALTSMGAAASKPATTWGDHVRNAFRHSGPWPKISIWHGSADDTVHISNARETTKQWINVHGLAKRPETYERSSGFTRRVWANAEGAPTVERYDISGMTHGIALGNDDNGAGYGRPGQYFLDVGVSSSRLIANFWQLLDPVHCNVR
jgi:poly(hydroxyalkanoate) depolymerase family esterase